MVIAFTQEIRAKRGGYGPGTVKSTPTLISKGVAIRKSFLAINESNASMRVGFDNQVAMSGVHKGFKWTPNAILRVSSSQLDVYAIANNDSAYTHLTEFDE